MSFIHPDSPLQPGAGNGTPLHLTHPAAQPERERLRHLILGSTEGVRSTIHTLHVLRYADQSLWSPLFTIPESGILLTPDQGEVFSYLLRYHQVG